MATKEHTTMRTLHLGLGAAALLGPLCALTGCGGGGTATLTALDIYPDAFTARVGDRIAFSAVATYSNGGQANVTTKVTWASSDPAAASISTQGVLTAAAPGATQVTASMSGTTSDPVLVTVVALPVLPTANHFPLVVGYLWRYTGTEVTPHGVAPTATITLTQTVPRQVVIDDVTWYEVQVKGSTPSEPPGYLYMRHDPEGLVRLEDEGHPPVKMLDASLAAGTTWNHPEDPHRSFTIESTTETVNVPAGTFNNCVKVVETDTNTTPATRIMAWFAAGTGIVWEQVWIGDDLDSEQKLVEFRPGV